MRQLGRDILEFAGENENIMPAPWPAPLGLMDTMAIGGYEPCCNVLRHYSQVKGRIAAKFAFLTVSNGILQFNSRRRPLNLRQNCSRFKRQSDIRVKCEIGQPDGAGRSVAGTLSNASAPSPNKFPIKVLSTSAVVWW
jgi:hypothetical protein